MDTPVENSTKVRNMDVKLVPVGNLKPHPKNRNKHPVEQIERLKKLIEYQGFRNPIIVSELSGLMVAGHGRLEAARQLGFKKVPVLTQKFDNEDQEYAYIQSDNAIASWAELDLSGINADLPEFDPSFDLDWLGIKDFVLDMAEIIPQCDEDEVPEHVEPKTKLGDIYKLGNHRLMCGDSTGNDIEKLMGEKIADITFTSPPYNLGDNAKLRGYNGDGEDTVYNEKSDHKSQEDYLSFLSSFTLNAINFSKTVFCNVQLLAGNKTALPKYWMAFNDHLIDLMVWDKEHAQPSAAAHVLNSVWEFIFILTKDKNPKRSIKTGKEFRGTIDNIFRLNPRKGKREESSETHGATFPVAFAEYFIDQFSKESVLDPFGGSGSTLIACEKTNRKCFMMELDPHYCDVIVARWEKYTGQKSELINGQT